MSGSRWVIKPLWLSGSWRSFFYSSSVYSCHLFLISSAPVRSFISVLYWAHLWMKYSLRISSFREEISSLSLSIVFLYFFALITEEGFLNLSLLFFGTLHSISFSSLHITRQKESTCLGCWTQPYICLSMANSLEQNMYGCCLGFQSLWVRILQGTKKKDT